MPQVSVVATKTRPASDEGRRGEEGGMSQPVSVCVFGTPAQALVARSHQSLAWPVRRNQCSHNHLQVVPLGVQGPAKNGGVVFAFYAVTLLTRLGVPWVSGKEAPNEAVLR